MEDPEKLIEHVGRRIAELRAVAGLTQAQAAELLRMTVSNYQRVEHGLQNLTIRTLVRIANVLEAPTAMLFERPKLPHARRGRPKLG